MSRTTTRFLVWALLAVAGSAAPTADAMTAAQLQAEIASGAKLTIVDVREPSVYARGHVPGAINVPASLCPHKTLPPVGKVVVYDNGLGLANTVAAKDAAAALGASPGVSTEILDGGFAAWESAHAVTTRGAGAHRESFNYITYQELKAARAAEVVLVDLRRPKSTRPLSDLAVEFPGMRQSKSAAEKSAAEGSSLLVLIDSADGTAEQTARTLKAAGSRRYVILAGGETIIARKGEKGLQRDGGSSALRSKPNVLTPGTVK